MGLYQQMQQPSKAARAKEMRVTRVVREDWIDWFCFIRVRCGVEPVRSHSRTPIRVMPEPQGVFVPRGIKGPRQNSAPRLYQMESQDRKGLRGSNWQIYLPRASRGSIRLFLRGNPSSPYAALTKGLPAKRRAPGA